MAVPLYDFECRQCHEVFERFLKIGEPFDSLVCPACGTAGPQKLATAFKTNSWSSFLDTMEKKVNPHKFK